MSPSGKLTERLVAQETEVFPSHCSSQQTVRAAAMATTDILGHGNTQFNKQKLMFRHSNKNVGFRDMETHKYVRLFAEGQNL